jgi:hypothetical protein
MENYNTLTPQSLAAEKYKLAVEYARLSEVYANHIRLRAEHFNATRADFKSDRACERAFETTEDGVMMEIVKAKQKSKEKRMSAISSLLKVASDESHNSY